jgi:hypothetical protein
VINNCYDILFWLVFTILINIIMRVISKVFCTEGTILSKAINKMLTFLEFNFYIDYINGNFLTLLAGSILNLTVFNFSNPGESLSSPTALLLLIFLLSYLLATFYLLSRPTLAPSMKDLCPDLSRPHRYYQQLIILRLLLLYLLLFALEAYPIIAYNLSLFYLGFPYLLYVWCRHPYEDRGENRLEVFNQAVVVWCMVCSWPMVPGQLKRRGQEVEVVAGYMVVGGYVTVSAVNIGVQIWQLCKAIWELVKRAVIKMLGKGVEED